MHYGVARILEKEGILESLFTDFYAGPILGVLNRLPEWCKSNKIKKLLGRNAEEIPLDRIVSFPIFGIAYAWRVARAATVSERDTVFLKAGDTFGRKILRRGFGASDAIYGFNTASLRLFERAREQSLITILEQTICPRLVEEEIMSEERRRFPGWEANVDSKLVSRTGEREALEWELADLILCPSEFVKDGVIRCGGSANKCVVVPYGVEPSPNEFQPHPRLSGPLRVLTVGAIGLRKGLGDILHAARLLGSEAEFRLVGSHQVSGAVISDFGDVATFIDAVPRREIIEHYRWADVFLLPSLCEGSATVTYEAMAHGLPVVCTHNTGSVVRDGVEGFVIPIRSPNKIASKLRELIDSESLLLSMSACAYQRSLSYTLDAYAIRLMNALRECEVT